MRSAPFCVNHKNRIIIAYLFQFINLDKLIYKKLTLKFNEVYLSKTMTELKTELKMYSSFYMYHLIHVISKMLIFICICSVCALIFYV